MEGNRRYRLLTIRRTTNNDVGEGSLWAEVAIALEKACQLSGKSFFNFSQPSPWQWVERSRCRPALRPRLPACERSPASLCVRDVQTWENRPSPSQAPAREGLFIGTFLPPRPRGSASRSTAIGARCGGIGRGWSARRSIGPTARRSIGPGLWCIRPGGRRRGGIRSCARNISRGWRQVRLCAGDARIIARRRAGRRASAGRLAIIGRRRIIIVPAAAGEKGAGHRYANCQKFHAPLLCVRGGQKSNKSAAASQEEGSGQFPGNFVRSPALRRKLPRGDRLKAELRAPWRRASPPFDKRACGTYNEFPLIARR